MAEKAGSSAAVRAPVRLLGRVVDGLAGEVSASRLRQLRMVVGMWGRALEVWPAGQPKPARTSRALFEEEALATFWALAAAGDLRVRKEREGGPLSVASLRVVRDCLGILADEVVPGREVWLPEVSQQEPKAAVPGPQLVVLYRRLADMVSDAPVERAGVGLEYEHRVRLLAMMSVVLDTGCRSVELEAMKLANLAEGEAVLVVRRHRQNGAHLAVVVEEFALRDGTRVALRQWLRVRDKLVAPLEGGQPTALWVSLRAHGLRQPEPGFPLLARGIQRSYATGARALNGLMAGRPGWSPLPTTLEQLRRAVVVPGPLAGR